MCRPKKIQDKTRRKNTEFSSVPDPSLTSTYTVFFFIPEYQTETHLLNCFAKVRVLYWSDRKAVITRVKHQKQRGGMLQIQRRHTELMLAQRSRYRHMTNCKAAHICVMLSRITLQVRNTSMIVCIAWANTANTLCHLQTDASLPRDSSASVQSPPTHPLFFLESQKTFAHTALSSNHRSQIEAKYRWWGRAIGSCQMRPHYQPLTVRRLCSSIMTSHCTCLSARPTPHTGTQVRLNIAVLSLSVCLCCPTLHHSARRPHRPLC